MWKAVPLWEASPLGDFSAPGMQDRRPGGWPPAGLGSAGGWGLSGADLRFSGNLVRNVSAAAYARLPFNLVILLEPTMLDLAKTFVKRRVVEKRRRQDSARRMELAGGFGGLPPELWGYAVNPEGELCLEGVRVTGLAEEFGTPLYLVHLPWLRKTHDDFIRPFRDHYPRVQLATSYKTNPLPAVLAALHAIGTHAEVISEFELWLAGRLGLKGDRIIVNGPGKTRGMIRRAVDMQVRLINLDGPGEIDPIAAEAQHAGRPQPVGVRVVTSVGWSSQFGLPIRTGDALACFERIQQNPWLVPVGVHLHIGTGLKNVEQYTRAVREVLEFGQLLKTRLGIELQTYDLGGGFGVPTVRNTDGWDTRGVALGYPVLEAFPDDCPSPTEYAKRTAALFSEFLPDAASPPEIVFEPGRAITSGAQSLLLRVIAVKEIGGVRKLILDGGKNITMPLGWEAHKIFPVTGLNGTFNAPTDLFGPLCHPGDVVARHLPLPRLGVGDAVLIMDAGAYFVPNQMNFSNPRPAAVTVDAGVVRLARERESFEDIVRLDHID